MASSWRLAMFGAGLTAAALSVLAAQAQDYNETQLGEKYKSSVFKVYTGTGNSREPIGTATLIDKRGYFLTASHVIEAAHDYDKDKPNRYSGLLYLVNPTLGLEVTGKEVFHSSPWQTLDVSVIQVDVSKAEHKLVADIAPVEPLIAPPAKANFSKLLLMGYKIREQDLALSGFIPSGEVKAPGSATSHFIVALGPAFAGQSGSLALNPQGKAVGILQGPRNISAPNPEDMKFTRLFAAVSFLRQLPPRDTVAHLLDRLRHNRLDPAARRILADCDISSIDALSFIAALERDIPSYKAGAQANFMDIVACLQKREFFAELYFFAWKFYAGEVTLQETGAIDAARILHKVVRTAQSEDLKTGQEAQYLSTAIQLYEGVLQSKVAPPDKAPRNAYLSNAFHDLALAYSQRDGFAAASADKINAALRSSLSYNDQNYKAYWLAANALRVRGDEGAAVLAAANASQFALIEAEGTAATDQERAARLKKISDGIASDFLKQSGGGAWAKASTSKGQLDISTMVKAQLRQ